MGAEGAFSLFFSALGKNDPFVSVISAGCHILTCGKLYLHAAVYRGPGIQPRVTEEGSQRPEAGSRDEPCPGCQILKGVVVRARVRGNANAVTGNLFKVNPFILVSRDENTLGCICSAVICLSY